MRRSGIIAIVINLAIVLALILQVPTATAAFKYLREGMPAPSISGTDVITNARVSTDEIGKDKLIIVVFWASWSKRSLQELEDLKEIASKYQDLPVQIIGVNVEGQTISDPVRKHITKIIMDLNLPFPVIIDYKLDAFYRYGVIAVPSTAVIDTTGSLRYGPSGYSLTTRDRLEDSIQVLLGLKLPDTATVVATGYQPKLQASRYYGLALKLVNQRMYERALANLVISEQADTLFAGPHLLRGEIFLNLDSLEAAASEFSIAVALDSGLVPAWSGWGRALMRQEKLDIAFERLATAIKLDDTYTPAVLDLGLCLAKMGDTQAALDSLTKARELNLKDPMVHYYLGQVSLKKGDTAAAAESFKIALELIYAAK